MWTLVRVVERILGADDRLLVRSPRASRAIREWHLLVAAVARAAFVDFFKRVAVELMHVVPRARLSGGSALAHALAEKLDLLGSMCASGLVVAGRADPLEAAKLARKNWLPAPVLVGGADHHLELLQHGVALLWGMRGARAQSELP